MNKPEFIEVVAKKMGKPKTVTTQFLDCILDTIMENMEKHEEVCFQNFGRFTIQYKPPREGLRPGTTERIIFAEKHIPRFNPSQKMNDAVSR